MALERLNMETLKNLDHGAVMEAFQQPIRHAAETVQLIQQTACDAQQARALPELSGDGRKAFVQQGDQIKEFALPAPRRQHRVHSLVDLIPYARRPDNPAPVVWHGADRARLLIDDSDRRDAVDFPLTRSKRFETLRVQADSKPAFDQPRFIRLLRIELGLDNLKIVAQFRRLDWSAGAQGVSEVQHGMDKMGKSILAKVQGIDELPDQLDVSVPVYQQSGERTEYVVRCAIEIDTQNQRFQLVPLPDELERVLDLAQAAIHQRLTASLSAADGQNAIPVYYGEP